MRLLISILVLLCVMQVSAQHWHTNEDVYYQANRIAVKKGNECITFYSYYGKLKKQIDINLKLLTHFGLPFEAQEIILYGLPEQLKFNRNTFPIFMHKEKNENNIGTPCKQNYYYNSLGLVEKQIQKCANDIVGGDQIIFTEEFEYNIYGDLVKKDGDTINTYNHKGQLVKHYVKDRHSLRYVYLYEYFYNDSLLVKSYTTRYQSSGKVKYRKVNKYEYDSRGNMIKITEIKEVITDKKPSYDLVFTYNNFDKLTSVIQKFRSGEQHFLLEYGYDKVYRVNMVKILDGGQYPYIQYNVSYNESGYVRNITSHEIE